MFLQTNIYICKIITWLQLAGKHLQSHIPITCPLAPHLSEQLSRGASTQVDPKEEVQFPGANGGSSWARRRSLPGPKLHPAARGYLEARTNNLGFSQYFAPDVVISPLWSLQNLASTSSSELKTSSQMIHHKDWKLSEEFCKTKRHVAISCCLVTFLKRQLQNWVWFRLSERSILSEQTEGVEGEREGKGRRLKRFQFQSVGK